MPMTQNASELLARLKVQGFDEYKRELRSAGEETKSFVATAATMGKSLISNLISPLTILTGGAGVGSLIAFGAHALHASADVQSLRDGLESLSGSAEKADAKMRFIRQLAIPSPFKANVLAEAGQQIEGFGLRLEKVLPLITKLAATSRSPMRLMEGARLFGEIASGKPPELRQLAEFGLSRRAFEKKGLQFDSEGRMKASALDAMNALASIINDRYGTILDKMGEHTNAKLTSLEDVWDQFSIKIGDNLGKYVVPILEKMTIVIENLTKGNKMERFVHGLATAFASLIGYLKIGVALLGGFATAAIITNFARLALAVLAVARGMSIAAVMAAVMQAIMSKGIGIIVALGAALVGLFAALNILNGINKIQDKMEKDLKKMFGDAAGGGMPEGAEKGPFSNSGDDNDLMAQIARNTNNTASNTAKMADVKKYALGGGDLGQIGVTPSEIYGSGRGGQVNVNVQGASGHLHGAIVTIVQETAMAMRRQGHSY